ncbi:hypothetical protein [Shewanella waksmanii]|uniref:hypothetical protein n=1 Tax=Shewanella waksmanii TaxID=213783 RepID=UPI000491ADA3|nr:hypothetical protein [Shewanella waksmanii]
MMELITYPGVGLRGSACKGRYFFCQFGHRYLICRPVDRPDDPLLSPPRMDLWCATTYGMQFLSQRHQWKNSAHILSQLVSYLSGESLADSLDEYEQLEHLATVMMQRQLLVFPLESSGS